MAGKNPFGPEDKTAPSRRNPVLDAKPTREAVAVVEVPTPPAAMSLADLRAAKKDVSGTFRKRVDPVERRESERPTDDAAGPSTPRPRLSPDTIPRIVLGPAAIRTLPLGPRDAFLLTYIDGQMDSRMLVEVAGMSRLEVSRILEKLVDLGAIEVR